MPSTIVMKQHDTKPTFTDTPTIDGVPVPPADFVGCTLKWLFKDMSGIKPPISQTAVINPDGTFSYQPVPTDVDTTGKYRQEWEVTYPGPSPQKLLTFPNNGYNVVKIIEDLG